MDLPARKPIQLKNYDYSSPGAYFITVCTHDRRSFLSEIVQIEEEAVGAIHESPAPTYRCVLTEEGKCVERVLHTLPERWPEFRLDSYVIMPNHIHLLLIIESERALREAPLREGGRRSLISKCVGYLKMNSSREIRRFRPDERIWQRSFYDHIVRNDDDCRQIAEYIAANPAKWSEDRFYPGTGTMSQ